MPEWNARFDLHLDLGDLGLLRLLIAAEEKAKAVNGIPIPPHVRAALNRLNIARTVRGTTGIEGAQLTQEEVEAILAATSSETVLPSTRQREEQEARNAAEVMSYAAQLLEGDPGHIVSESLIRRFHEILTTGIDYPHNTPGQYREFGVSAGEFVPPRDGDTIRRLMPEFVNWLNSPTVRNWPAIARAVAAHFYLVSIHPFGDGNGRTSRALESFLLYQSRVNALGFYSLANFYYQHRAEYIDMLNYTRDRSGGDLTPFVRFCAQALVDELEVVYREVLDEATVIAYRDFARETLQELGRLASPAGSRMLSLLHGLSRERVAVAKIRNGGHPLHSLYDGVSGRTLSRDIEFLRKTGLLDLEEGFVRARVEAVDHYRP